MLVNASISVSDGDPTVMGGFRPETVLLAASRQTAALTQQFFSKQRLGEGLSFGSLLSLGPERNASGPRRSSSRHCSRLGTGRSSDEAVEDAMTLWNRLEAAK